MDKKIIHRVFEHVVRQFPEHTAVDEGSRSLTYQKLNASANRVAHALREFGVGSQSVVGIYFDSSIEYIAAILGVLKAGAIFFPLDTRFPGKRFAYLLEKTRPQFFITTTSLEHDFLMGLEKLSLSVCVNHMIVLDDACNFRVTGVPGGTSVATSDDFADENPPLTTGPDQGCYIVTTSGSTGVPKAILGCHEGLCHHILWEIDQFGLSEKVRASLLPPVTFDSNVRDIFIPLSAGGTLCIPDEETRRNPGKLFGWIQDKGITIVHIVPTLFRMLTQAIQDSGCGKDALANLEHVMIAGEPLYGNDVINWRKTVGGRTALVNLYGPTETTIVKVFHRIQEESLEPNKIVSIGRPIGNTEVLIIKNSTLCTAGETGEIYIKTPYLTKGYYNDPKLTEMVFVQNPLVKGREDIVYKTGDYGKCMPDGSLRFVGRIDGQIKLHGIRIEMGEIEVVLSQHPQIRQAAVAAKEDAFGNKRLVGYIVPEPGETPPVESLRRFIGDRLPDYMMPTVFVTLKALPLTPNRKINRRALPEPDRVRPELEQTYVSPSTPMEKTLSESWCHVLGIDLVGINDNFFDLGGTSILAVKLIARLQQAHGIELPIVKLFQYPNISLLASYLSRRQSDQPSHEKFQDRAQRRRAAFSRQRRATMGR